MTSLTITPEEQESLHDTYRYLHKHPELSMQEHATAEYLERRLDDLGIPHFRCGGTGVVGVLENGQGPVIGLRADTDGLPIQEDTGADYSSVSQGVLEDGTVVPVMHGCGHDAHMATALTAAELMRRDADGWRGTIVLLFQPGEETAAGAAAMVADGLWDRAPRPELIVGQHVFPRLPAGSVGLTTGVAMAMADSLRVTVHGVQSHGSQPQDATDPIVLAAHMIIRLQTIVSRELSALESAVVTCGTVHAGLKENIIPDQAEFTINVRTLTENTRQRVLTAITRILNAEADASAAPRPDITEIYHFPRLFNDPGRSAQVSELMREELGSSRVLDLPAAMGSEDFGALPDAIGVPGVYWLFGGFTGDTEAAPINHSPYFLPDMEPTLSTGVRALVSVLRGTLDAAE